MKIYELYYELSHDNESLGFFLSRENAEKSRNEKLILTPSDERYLAIAEHEISDALEFEINKLLPFQKMKREIENSDKENYEIG